MSLVSLSAVFYLRMSLVRDDRRFQSDRLLEYWAVYRNGGLDLVRRELSLERLAREDRLFALRIAGRDNRTIFLYKPLQWVDFDLAEALVLPLEEGRVQLARNPNSVERLEVSSLQLFDGNILQLAISTGDRDGIVSGFALGSALLTLATALIGIVAVAVVARQLIRPLTDLSDRVAAIPAAEFGKMPLAIPSATREVQVLVDGFNSTGSRIQQLMAGFRDGLDNVAHDLQTPVTRLMQRAELALEGRRDDPEALAASLNACLEEARLIQGIIRSVVEISRAENTVGRDRDVDIDLVGLAADLVDLYSYAREEGTSRFVFAPTEDTCMIRGNPDTIRQALANVMDNALKYSPEGSSVYIGLEVDGTSVRILIRDEGEGIGEQDLPHIWERMYRGDKSRSKPGTGLGLALVKAIVEAHRGHVAVDSRLGEGSTFTLSFPLITDL